MNDDPREFTDAGVRLRFHRNEAPLDPPASVLNAIRNITGESLRTYPIDAQAKLASTLAASLGASPDRVVLANGADEILLGLGRALLSPGSDALIVTPAFGMYERAICLAGGVPRMLAYAKPWDFDAQAFVELATPRTRLAILGNPNNPTGETLSAEDVAFIAESLPYVTVAIDEVYLAYSDRSIAKIVSTYENVVIVSSFSKIGLAGVRVGYAVGSEKRIAPLRRSISPYPLGVASIAAVQAYLDDAPGAAEYRRALSKQIDRSLDSIVSALAPFAKRVWRGPANFALFDFGDEGERLSRELAARGIAVRTYENPALKGMIRMCAGSDDATAELIESIRPLMGEVARA